MTGPGAPRRGRHASPEDGLVAPSTSWLASPVRGVPAQRATGPDEFPAGNAGTPAWDAGTPSWDASDAWASGTPSSWETPAPRSAEPPTRPSPVPAPALRDIAAGEPDLLGGTARSLSGLLERRTEETGPLATPQFRHRPPGSDGDGAAVPSGTPAGVPAPGSAPAGGAAHPSAPLPPFPPSAWSRLQLRRSGAGEDGTQDTPAVPPAGNDRPADDTQAHDVDWAATGGLEVIGAHVDEVQDTDVHAPWADDEPPGRGGNQAPVHEDLHEDLQDDVLRTDEHDRDDGGPLHLGDEDIPVAPYDARRVTRRRRRRRVAVLVSLVVLGALALGVVLGGRQVLGLINPPDYPGQGTGTVQIRVHDGDTLKAIGQTMVDGGVIASVRPFVKAAEGEPQATSIAPGLYGLRSHMSAKAALQLLLQPGSRLVSRVTIPEGLTAAATIARVAQSTGTPVARLQAAATDPAALGLPAYAGGKVEGFLFPATYDFEPGTTPTDMLRAMVARAEQSLDKLAVPEAQRLQVLTEASIVQAEARTPQDMAKVARVLNNRVAIGMPLQLDTTVNYANGKNGVTTTAQDRANPSPYNTYAHPGLPPGPISNPGEDALHAVLAPADGAWLYFVVINPDTGETRFAVTAEEAKANTALFQQWLREHPGR